MGNIRSDTFQSIGQYEHHHQLLNRRNLFMNSQYIEDRKRGTIREVVAYWAYSFGILGGILTLLSILHPNPLREHLARSWLMYIVVTGMPITKMFRFAKAMLVGIPTMGGGLVVFSQVTYGVFGYSPTAPTSIAWILGSLAIYLLLAWVVARIVRAAMGVSIQFSSDDDRKEWAD